MSLSPKQCPNSVDLVSRFILHALAHFRRSSSRVRHLDPRRSFSVARSNGIDRNLVSTNLDSNARHSVFDVEKPVMKVQQEIRSSVPVRWLIWWDKVFADPIMDTQGSTGGFSAASSNRAQGQLEKASLAPRSRSIIMWAKDVGAAT